jgi:hypothetical protein
MVFFSPLDAHLLDQQHVSMALQRAQAIGILQGANALGQGSSSLPHIIISAAPSLADLWQMTAFLS